MTDRRDEFPRHAGGPDDPPAVPFPWAEYEGLHLDPRYARLREHGPLRVRVPHGDDAWLVTRHEDVRTVLADPRFSRAAAAEHDEARLTPEPVNTSILGMDPPQHTRLRRLLTGAFTARRIASLRPRVRELADDLVARARRQGPPADLVEDFAIPLTGLIACEYLGVPTADHTRFRTWLDAFSSTTSLSPEEIRRRTGALYAYLAELVERRRADLGDDLVSKLIQDQQGGAELSDRQLVELVGVLLIAGYETSAAQLVNSIHVLLERPQRWEELRRDPSLVPAAVDELLRFVPLDAYVAFARYAVADVELGGALVRAGEAVLPVIPAANRDGAVFDDPEEVDFHRRSNPHLGFGHGIHHCLGAALARIELEEGIAAVLHGFPELRGAIPLAEMPWRKGIQVRIMRALPVRW
ncbi:cytochrome P450 [Saccharopolyspora rosea]|uniref:Cytochrome P450 n=1 Tax=Saccharopolyspora rosea TaxID=524884 RepID=A0ABW3FW45_9PSEU|nr:cytochrome P450 [Saccharopolyspora rosea]